MKGYPDGLRRQLAAALCFGNSMEITLKHNGPIPSGARGNKAHTALKHKIRLEFSQQVRRHWRKPRGLLAEAYARGLPEAFYKRQHYCVVKTDPEKSPFFKVDLCGFSVIPIVSGHNWLACELDITFLGNERRPFTDLDNQVKFVVDALRMPQEDQVPASMRGRGDELFCLVEDDSLISKYCVRSSYGGTGSPPAEELLVTARIVYDSGPGHPAVTE